MRVTITKWAIILAGSCFLIFFGACRSIFACETTSIPTKVGRTIRVEVADRGKPVAGLPIELSTFGRNRSVAMVRTDASGYAQFKNIHPGLYFVGVKHPAFHYSEEIQVLRHPPDGTESTISFEWPGFTPLSIQDVSGFVRGRARTSRPLSVDMTSEPIYGRVAGAKLTLSKAVSNETVRSVITGEAGDFDFGDVPPGLYFLRVETPVTKPVRWLYPVDGYVPLEMDPSAKLKQLDLVLDNAICGELAWSNHTDGR